MVTTIVLALCIAALRRRTTLADAVAGVVSCLGVLLLLQPAFIFGGISSHELPSDPCPCFGQSALRSQHCLKMDDINSSLLQTNNSNDYTDSPWTPFSMRETSFGYILAVVTGAEFTLFLEISKTYLLSEFHFTVVCFWVIVVALLSSIVGMLALETPLTIGLSWCTVALVGNCVTGSFVLTLSNVILDLTSVAELSVLSTLGIVMLFIVQSTFLADVRESKGNAFEVLGAILIITACLITPAWVIFKKVTSDRRKDDVSKEESQSLVPNGVHEARSGYDAVTKSSE